MKQYRCPECGDTIFMTNEDMLCKQCRIAKGLSPYEFVGVYIRPFVKGAEAKETYVTLGGEEYTETWVSQGTGLEMVATVKGWGFCTIEFWIGEDEKWHVEEGEYETLPDDFLEEAFKFWLANLIPGEEDETIPQD